MCNHSFTPSKMTKVAGKVARVTEKAVMFTSGGRDTWIPRSQIEAGDKVAVGDTMLMVLKWFAEKEGLTPAKEDANAV
jgi:hypothetical protein